MSSPAPAPAPVSSTTPIATVTTAVKAVVTNVTTFWSKIANFLKTFKPLHWVAVALAIILIIGGIYGLIQIKNLFASNSAIIKQLDTIRTNSLSISSDLTELGGYIKQSNDLINRLNSNDTTIKDSLGKLESDSARLNEQLKNSAGYADTIDSNNTTANDLIKSVAGSVQKALNQSGPASSSSGPSN